jgi:predicted DsbA family dithiol-disulfide isomerase
VPTFIINDKYRFVGGQPVDEFVTTLAKIVAEENLSEK